MLVIVSGLRSDPGVRSQGARWLERIRPRPEAEVVLVCLPFAGGSPETYAPWASHLPSWVELCAVSLPGHDTRRHEPPLRRMEAVIQALVDALEAEVTRPYAVFGHSMGGLMALECCREVRRRGLPHPGLLLVSSSLPPREAARRKRPRSRALLRQELWASVARTRGQDPSSPPPPGAGSWLDLVLPAYEADMELLASYRYTTEAPLAVPLQIFGGSHDPQVPPDRLGGWVEEAERSDPPQLLPGGHFYLVDQREALLRRVCRGLQSVRVVSPKEDGLRSAAVPAWSYLPVRASR